MANAPDDDILPGGLIDGADPVIRARLEQNLAQVRRGELSGGPLSDALYDFGEAGFLKARRDIEKHLTHPNAFVRHRALTALVLDWALSDHRVTAQHFLLRDPDKDNRSLGAICLGNLAEGSQDAQAVRILCGVLRDEREEHPVRARAYEALLAVLGVPKQDRLLPLPVHEAMMAIDWSIVRGIEESFSQSRGPSDERNRARDMSTADAIVQTRLETGLAAVRCRALAGESLCRVLHEFGEAGFLAAHREVEVCLVHSDELVRHTALIVLTLDWGLQEHRTTSERFLLEDPDAHNRSVGAVAIGKLTEGTQDPEALRVLRRVVCDNSERDLVRVAAYDALLAVLSIPGEERGVYSTVHDIDWSVVERIGS